MRFGLVSLVFVSLLSWPGSDNAVGQSSGKKTLHSFLAVKKGAKRTNTFSADAPTICAFWESENLALGGTIGVVWIAEDVGAASPKATEIRRANYRVFRSGRADDLRLLGK